MLNKPLLKVIIKVLLERPKLLDGLVIERVIA